jgi:transcriptional regulator with XRE-family HTH domain
MSLADCGTTDWNVSGEVPVPEASGRSLHRLKAVRLQQGLSRRRVAERLKITIEQVREQECETTDLSMSELYAWQKVLDVPVGRWRIGRWTGFPPPQGIVGPVLSRPELGKLVGVDDRTSVGLAGG